jgi:hypothetical protein
MHMLRWIVAYFGLDPIEPPVPQESATSKHRDDIESDEMRWPDGPQIRKEVRSCEPAGWAHSDWAWRSNGHVDHLGSVHPKLNKAERRSCLGVLRCEGCGTLVRPSTKGVGLQAQLEENCTCGSVRQRVACEARTYRFVVKEGDVEYSVWEHTGYHHSHPRPPVGRQPPRAGHTGHKPSSLPQNSHLRQGRSRTQTRTRKACAIEVAGSEETITACAAPLPPAPSSMASSSNAAASLVRAPALVPAVFNPEVPAASAESVETVAWNGEK